MILLQKRLFGKILAVILALFLVLNPGLTHSLVLAEETTSQNQETGEGSQNTADSDSSEQTSVENNNQAEVVNDVETEANTGDNLVDDPAGGGGLEGEGLGEGEDNLGSQEQDGSEEEGETSEPEIQTNSNTGFMGTESTTAGILALNENTGEGSENLAQAVSENQTEVTNDNEAEVENGVSGMAETGENQVEGEESLICTGDAETEADIVNVVNTNLIGLDFWQAVVNVFGTSDNDIDLTQIEGFEYFNPALISVLAQNENTGDGSVNLALADFLSSFAVYNTNEATLSNNIDLLASTGNNQIIGDDGQIQTGEASAILNLFNLVNTNLVGNNWFFGIINLFGELNGDIVLPYELQFLGEDGIEVTSQVAAINQNTGEDSTNQAQASAENQVEVTNTNEAALTNDVSVLANSGENEIIGGGSIQTGDADASANLVNMVNTNIFGSRWLLLVINNFGNWTGNLVGWWGNLFSDGNTTFAWIRLPDIGGSQASEVSAINENTGENSENYASAQQSTSLLVENNNLATVENNLSVVADSGNNQIEGESASIQTGNANASANIFNFINTNIIGNNWFFGIINIFGDFLGNIIFPRPDLSISKVADYETISPGEEIIYTISYKNQGQVWAKNVTISDTLSLYTTFVSASDGGVESGGVVTWNLGTIAKGEEKTVNLTVRVSMDVPEGTVLINNVLISTTTEEPEKDNNSSSTSTTVMTASSSGSDGASIAGIGGSGTGTCCPPQAPEAPTLLSVTSTSPTEAELSWTPVDRASYYLIAYGLSSGDYTYGVPSTGDVTSFIIGGLSPGVTYYFVVAAVVDGDCPAPGSFSNELASSWLEGILAVQAAEEEKVLGIIPEKECPEDEDIFPYVLLFLLSSYWIVDKSRKMFKIRGQL